jgi:hypothetical protein
MAAWSIAKFEVGAVASAARTSSGVRLRRLGDPGHRIRQAAPLVQSERGNLPAHPGISIGHRRGAPFVPGGDVVRSSCDECVGDVEVPAADDAEYLPDAQTR